MPDPFGRVALSVPLDDDLITGTNGQTTTGDGIADKWEIAMGKRWALQYGVAEWTDAVALTKFNNAFDDELADPDGAAGPLVEQGKPGPNLPGETGDAHEVKEEYRGYILDGGSGGFTGGHIRLDPARKEILVEADRAAVLNNLPEGGLKGVLNGASGVFSNPTRGAGIYMYWLMDEEELAAPTVLELATDDAMEASRDTAAERQNPTSNRLATDFIHVFFVDANLGNSAATSDRGPLVKRAVGVSISEMNKKYAPGNAYGVVNIPEAYMTVLAHEITHMLVEPGIVGVWDKFEHIVGPAATYQSELMYAAPTKKNRELATVTISTTVQQEMKVKSNQGIV